MREARTIHRAIAEPESQPTMRYSLTIVSIALMMGEVAAQTALPARGNVDVRHVMLATGGLAQVEGAMTAPSDVMRLAIERSQVADVLRTLVVTGDVAVRAVELPAAEPVGPRSPTGRLLEADLSTPYALLEAHIGEVVEVSGGASEMTGRLLGITRVTLPGSNELPEIPAFRLALAGRDGRVAYATFPEADPLSVGGSAVDATLAALAPVLSASVDDARRQLDIRFAGETDAGFSFIVPTTVWRPSYRALVSEEGVLLQGWATLENTTGLDWTDISLDLAVGTPVAFAQDVYSPLRTTRPDAPFEVGRTIETDALPPSPAMAADAAPGGMMQLMSVAPQRMEARRAKAAEAAELEIGGAADVGSAITVYPVAGPISLAAGRTLTVPFVASDSALERIAYLDLVSSDGVPMDALEGDFGADATLPGGLIAVYDDGRFVGDARFGGADAGETAILPFAVSADLNVRRTEDNRQLFVSAEFDGGSLIVRREGVTTVRLAIEAADAVTLVADLARHSNAEIETEPAADIVPLSPQRARLRADVPAGASTLTIRATQPYVERFIVGSIPEYIVEEVLSLGGRIDAQTRERLEELAERARAIAAMEREMATVETDVEELQRAVAADRANLEAIDVRTPEGAAVRRRIVERTNEIDAMLTRLRALRQERLAAQNALR